MQIELLGDRQRGGESRCSGLSWNWATRHDCMNTFWFAMLIVASLRFRKRLEEATTDESSAVPPSWLADRAQVHLESADSPARTLLVRTFLDCPAHRTAQRQAV